jgi:Zn-dependent peptidase ImmA (M78 family)
MRRGFKAEAERLATQVRTEMQLGAYKPMDIKALARHVGAELRTAEELTSLSKLEELEALQPGAFSACTFDLGTRKIIVVSPLATEERRRSDACHEASHLLLGHKVREIEQLGGLSFFTCDPDEEQEASWLAGCLLLPRDLITRSLRNGLDAAAIAEANTVSIQMANFRIRATGAERQVSAASRR